MPDLDDPKNGILHNVSQFSSRDPYLYWIKMSNIMAPQYDSWWFLMTHGKSWWLMIAYDSL